MAEQNRLDGKCLACGHVWTLCHLPGPMNLVPKFAKLPCPKCYAPKPVLAERGDLTAEDRLTAILRRAHDAVSCLQDGISAADWDSLLADMAKELGVTDA